VTNAETANSGIEIWEAISAAYCYTTNVGGDKGACLDCGAPTWYYSRALCRHRDSYHYQARTILNMIGCCLVKLEMRSPLLEAARAFAAEPLSPDQPATEK